MAIELAAAYISIIPEMRGIGKKMQAQLSGVDLAPAGKALGAGLTSGLTQSTGEAIKGFGGMLQNAGGAIQGFGGRVSQLGGTLTSKITMPAIGAAAAVGGIFVAGGFKRLVAIDTARAQFKGLGHDADAVMAQVGEGVNGTALSMAQGASLAVGILATGNKAAVSDLEGQLKRVANVSAAYNVESGQAGYLLNNVLTKNKVTYGDLSQMVENGIPIISDLAEHYGVAGDEIEKMARDGKISIEDMNAVIDSKAGAAAEEYSKSWEGISANIRSNISKIGAAFLEGVFPDMKASLAGFLDTLKEDRVKAFATRAGSALKGLLDLIVKGDVTGKLQEALGWDGDTPIVAKIQRIRDGVIGLYEMLAKGNFTDSLARAFNIDQNSPIVGLLQLVHENLGKITAGAVLAGPALMLFGGIAGKIGGLVSILGSITSGVGSLVGFLGRATAGLGGMAGAGGGLSGILRGLLGPVGLIITAIALMWANSETFRNAVMELGQKLWDVAQQIMTAVAPILAQLGPMFAELGTMLGDVAGQLLAALMPLIGFVLEQLVPVFTFLADVIVATMQWIMDVVTPVMAAIQSIIAAVMAAIQGDWSGAWEHIKAAGLAIWDAIVALIGGAINLVWTVISGALTMIATVWSNVWAAVGSTVLAVWDAIKGWVTAGIDVVKSTISNGVNAAKNVITNVFNSIVGFIASIPGKIFAGLAQLAQLAAKSAEWFLGFVKSARDKFNEAVAFVKEIPSKILGALGNLGSYLKNSGSALINGFTQGIKDGFNKAKDAVAGGLAKIRDFFPFSPAKKGPFSGKGYTTHSGKKLLEDFGVGITAGQAKAVAAGEKAMAALAKGFEGGKSKASKAAAANAKKIAQANAKAAEEIDKAYAAVVKKIQAAQVNVAKVLSRDYWAAVSGTAKQATSMLNKIVDELNKVGIPKTSALAKYVTTERDNLAKILATRDQVMAKIKTATANLNAMIADQQKFVEGVYKSSFDLGAIFETDASAGDMVQGLKDQIAATKAFNANLTALRKMGISDNLLEQFAQQGVEKGGAAAKALLAGGKDAVKQVNDLEKQLNSESKKLASSLGSQLYDAGINAAKGLVAGLQSQQSALVKQAQALAVAIHKAIKDELQIKSPSRVLRADGSDAGAGLTLGLRDQLDATEKAARALAAAAVPDLAPFTVPSSAGAIGSRGQAPVSVMQNFTLQVPDWVRDVDTWLRFLRSLGLRAHQMRGAEG